MQALDKLVRAQYREHGSKEPLHIKKIRALAGFQLGLSHEKFNEYLQDLTELGMVEFEKGNILFRPKE